MTNQDAASLRIAVIGAGVAGVACARLLADRGFRPTIFEKSRGLGGRLATRRAGDSMAFDHGAQFVTARTPAFRTLVERAIAAGAAARWRPRGVGDMPERDDWIVGTPGMNALIKPAAAGQDIRFATEVAAIDRDRKGWRIRTSQDGSGQLFDVVVCTAPAPQARALLASEPAIADAVAGVEIAPCWTLMIGFGTPVDPGFDLRLSQSAELAWVCRDTSKLLRGPDADCWVVHASPEWSRARLELDRERATAAMIELLPAALGRALPDIRHAAAHRWRYSRTTVPLGSPCLRADDGTLFVGGDWCLGARVEYAFESGRAIAHAIIDED